MGQFFVSILVAATVVTIGAFVGSQNLPDIARANDDFGYQLLHRLEVKERSMRRITGKPMNLLISPFSLGTVLTMAMTGAISDTREEIKRTLGFDADVSVAKLSSAYRILLQNLRFSTLFTRNVFQLANAAALIDQFALLTAYQNTVENDFSATIFSVNLSEAATTINNWANEHTHGKIPKLLDEKTDLSNTVMILLNALYFKGVWANPFKKQLTADKEFTYSANSKVKVPMMSKSGWFKYTSSTEGQLLELPYEGNSQSMLLFLPKEEKEEMQHSISSIFSKTIKSRNSNQNGYESLRSQQLILGLPRFKIESSVEPVQELQSMGIRAAFDCEKANFSLMIDSERIIKVSEILQKTFIEVNEKGSEAAAATAVGFVAVSGQIRKPLTVEFNRPFLFAIRDNRLQLTLFAGIVNKP